MTNKINTPVAPATGTTRNTGSFGASGAPGVDVQVDVDHPALDADPRANTTAVQNRIDLNDPTKSGAETVAEALKAK